VRIGLNLYGNRCGTRYPGTNLFFLGDKIKK
jgi:hypothetical protein